MTEKPDLQKKTAMLQWQILFANRKDPNVLEINASVKGNIGLVI